MKIFKRLIFLFLVRLGRNLTFQKILWDLKCSPLTPLKTKKQN